MNESPSHEVVVDALAPWRCAQCPRCRYDLRGLADGSACPECGLDCVGAIMIRERNVDEVVLLFFVTPVLFLSGFALFSNSRVLGALILVGAAYLGYRGVRSLREAFAGRGRHVVTFCPSCVLIHAAGVKMTVPWSRIDRVAIRATSGSGEARRPRRAQLFMQIRGEPQRRGPMRDALAVLMPDWFGLELHFRATALEIQELNHAVDSLKHASGSIHAQTPQPHVQ